MPIPENGDTTLDGGEVDSVGIPFAFGVLMLDPQIPFCVDLYRYRTEGVVTELTDEYWATKKEFSSAELGNGPCFVDEV